MAQDFAKHQRAAGRKRAPARKKQPRRRAGGKQPQKTAGWRWYGAGVLTGVFLSFLLYLGSLPTPAGLNPEQQNESQAAAQPPKPRFDFYTMLPGETSDSVVEPAPEVVKPRNSNTPDDYYLLQAGSFRQREDAERRRAELLLLNLTPTVEEANGDNGRWYRVYVGPFESHSKMTSARSLTANQNIDTLLLKRNKN